MIRLLDGPAAGAYAARRAPVFLRAVVDPQAVRGDVLDQLDDRPNPNEVVHVYRLVPGTRHGTVFVRLAGRGCVESATGDYRYQALVDGEQLRDADAWRAWAEEQAGRLV